MESLLCKLLGWALLQAPLCLILQKRDLPVLQASLLALVPSLLFAGLLLGPWFAMQEH